MRFAAARMHPGMTLADRGAGLRAAAIALATLALGVPVVIALVRIAVRAGIPYVLVHGEGWNAYHALAAYSGGTLYFPPDALVANNYPPLSYYLVGSIGALVGDTLYAGRYVAFTAFLVTIFSLYLSARGLGADRLAAGFGALAAAAALLLVGSIFPGMNDPQMLAHGVAMAGLAVFVNPRLGRWSGGLLGGALIAASCFVKHMVVGLPLALFVSCLLFRRERVIPLMAGAIAVIAVMAAWIALAFGATFLQQFLSPRGYSIVKMILEYNRTIQPTFMMLAAALLLLLSFRPDFATVFAAFYTLLGYALALFFLGGDGVYANASFEGILGGGLVLALLLSRVGPGIALATVAIVVLQCALSFSVVFERRHLSWAGSLEVERAEAQDALADIALIRERPGPAICDSVALCYWAGKPFVVDPYTANQAFKGGTIPESKLLDQVRAKVFSTIQLSVDPRDPDGFGWHFSRAFRKVLEESYQVLRRSRSSIVFAPKP